MTQPHSPLTDLSQRRLPIALLLLALLFSALAYWSGLPAADVVPAFALGVAVMIGILAAFGVALWHLLLRPLPAGRRAPTLVALPVAQRRLLAFLIQLAAVNIVVGGFWDEVWHRQYGLPFGNDLFWRPHLMLYAGFLIVIVLAGVSLFWLLRRGRGTLQQRFRALPLLGLLALLGGFMLYALPADPLWHIIYGDDLTAWSLPHLVLFFCVMLIAVLAAAVYLSTVAEPPWRAVRRWQSHDTVVALALSWMVLLLIQILVTDWDNITSLADLAGRSYWNRPGWVQPVLLALAAGFAGTLANHAARRADMALLVAFFALVIRWVMVAGFGYAGMRMSGWIAALPLFAALSALYALRLRRQQLPALWESAGALTAGMLPTLLLIDRLYVYPEVTPALVGWTLPLTALVGLAASWLGRLAGEYVATANKQPAAVGERPAPVLRYGIPAATLTVVVFIVVFVLTATPPV